MAPMRTFQDALECLNLLENNASARKRATTLDTAGRQEQFKSYAHTMCIIGYPPEKLETLRIVHIAGSKGKGTTASMTASILKQFQYPKGPVCKIGLFTSPHIRTIRERIRIFQPSSSGDAPAAEIPQSHEGILGEELFAKYFFEIWDLVHKHYTLGNILQKPTYFKFLFAIAIHAFLAEDVDVAILECGIGGEYDVTNYIDKPLVSGICTLELEHTDLLGQTLQSIAWHKGGIMRAGIPTISVQQKPEAMEELHRRALEKGTSVTMAVPWTASDSSATGRKESDGHAINAGLARDLAVTVLKNYNEDLSHMDSRIQDGIKQCHLPGRFERRDQGQVEWYIDGAHTVGSLTVAAKWFCASTAGNEQAIRALIFNQEGRDTRPMLDALHHEMYENTSRGFTHVVFCSNAPFAAGMYSVESSSMNMKSTQEDHKSRNHQEINSLEWTLIDQNPSRLVYTFATTRAAVEFIMGEAMRTNSVAQCFVTGSMHLVGAVELVLDSLLL